MSAHGKMPVGLSTIPRYFSESVKANAKFERRTCEEVCEAGLVSEERTVTQKVKEQTRFDDDCYGFGRRREEVVIGEAGRERICGGGGAASLTN